MKNIILNYLTKCQLAAFRRIHKDDDFFRNIVREQLVETSVNIELAQQYLACITSAEYALKNMQNAQPVTNKLEILDVALNASKIDGFVCELGVYKGYTFNYIASKLPEKTIYGFDTFDGLPEDWRAGFPANTFNDVELSEIKFLENCKTYKGLFADTLPIFLQDIPEEKAKLIHVDCDLYSSTQCALDILLPRIVSGTVLVFDEYFNYPGWQQHEHKAFHEFLQKYDLKCEYIAYHSKYEQVAAIII